MNKARSFKFGGLEDGFSTYENSEIAILPVPFEKTSSWLKGARHGPSALLEASAHMELYDIETDSEVYLKGIYTADEINEEDSRLMVEKVRKKNLNFIRDSKFPVTVGGEHTVSLGAIKAACNFYENFSLLHLDAHLDSRDSYDNDPLSHACVMARVRELGLKVFSLGIRSMDASEKKNIDREKTVFAREFFYEKYRAEELLENMGKNVFVDIDLDVFDPSVIPATGTPEPGGLLWYQVTDFLKKVAVRKNILGLSVVELCPFKNCKISEFAAALLIYKILSYVKM